MSDDLLNDGECDIPRLLHKGIEMKKLLTLTALVIAFQCMPIFSVGEAYAFVKGDKKCAINVSRKRVQLGRRPLASAAAISAKAFPRISKRNARRGDLLWTERKGPGTHVALVWGMRKGVLICLNPSQRLGRWQEKPCDDIHKGKARSYHR